MTFSQSSSQQAKPVLEASAHDVRHIANALRGINFGGSQRATFIILPAGLSFLVEEARTLLAQAILPRSMFDSFEYNDPSNRNRATAGDTTGTTFQIELNALLTVFDIFGAVGSIPSTVTSGGFGNRSRKGKWGAGEGDADQGDAGGGIERFFSPSNGKLTGMRMTYVGVGHPLSLTLSEDASGPVTTCNISTLEPDDHLDLPFHDDDKIVKVIMKSSWLAEALSELDSSCDKLTIFCSPPTIPLPATSTGDGSPGWLAKKPTNKDAPGRPTFRLLGTSAYGSTEIDYPNDRDVLQAFECEDPTQFSYRFSHISRIARALQGSIKTSLRMNEEGVLSIQLMMPSVRVRGTESSNPFIEFKCLALDDDQ